ncbi:MAG TPA: hypothetical protein VHS53_05255 [Mucilaginibacter sp.]|jgi:hypothetical protein|nr:hypothetical protein [Mucilaginibacter sp.]
MRSAKTIFTLLLIFVFSKSFCFGKRFPLDTTKTIHKKRTNRPRVSVSISPDKIYYNDCVFTHKYAIDQRLKKYPFNKAAKILAVSFDGTPEADIDIKIGDTVPKRKPHGLIFQNDTLDLSNLFEIKELTSEEINRLTNIMFNTKVKVPNNYADLGYTCFSPRNALVFYDKDGKVYDYIQICFECRNYESKSQKLYLSTSGCNQDFDLIKKFLISVGLKFGTTTTDASTFN